MRRIDDAVGPQLAQRLLDAQAQQQRDAAIAAATAAVLSAGLSDPLLDEALGDLLEEKYSPGMRSAVTAVEEWLDERAWDHQSAVDAGRADTTEYQQAFRRARAAGAVKMCLDGDARTALNEAVYEAAHAVNGDERLAQLLESVLDLPAPGNHWAARELAHLFWPRFIEVDGYVLLASHYSPQNLAEWRQRHPNNPSAIEDVINHVHLEDIAADRVGPEAIRQTAHRIRHAWRETLDAQLPERKITVEFDEANMIVTAFSPVGAM
jgi:hypothetical protein